METIGIVLALLAIFSALLGISLKLERIARVLEAEQSAKAEAYTERKPVSA